MTSIEYRIPSATVKVPSFKIPTMEGPMAFPKALNIMYTAATRARISGGAI
jgi:hypothetical protein